MRVLLIGDRSLSRVGSQVEEGGGASGGGRDLPPLLMSPTLQEDAMTEQQPKEGRMVAAKVGFCGCCQLSKNMPGRCLGVFTCLVS